MYARRIHIFAAVLAAAAPLLVWGRPGELGGGYAGASYTLSAVTTGGQTPAILQNGVVNGASFTPGMAAGSWVTIQGNNLSDTTRAWRPDEIVNGNLPTQLDGVGVMIDGQPAYVSYISPTQINAQAPSNSHLGPVQVQVTNGAAVSAPVTAQLQSFSPAFFVWAGKFAVATRPDFTYVAAPGLLPGIDTTPATPGDIVILWGTGFGATTPDMPAGHIVDRTAVHNIATRPVIRIGGAVADYIGGALAPDYAGLYQIAVRVPSTTPDGDVAVTAEMGGVASPSNVLITVRK